MKRDPIKLRPATRLERHVANWLRERGKDYNSGIEGVAKDLEYGGCSSGMVSHLIYTKDCAAFYRRHMAEIDTLLKDTLSDCGGGVGELFARAGWDDSDPLAREDWNQNILAWFGFEETARSLMGRASAGN